MKSGMKHIIVVCSSKRCTAKPGAKRDILWNGAAGLFTEQTAPVQNWAVERQSRQNSRWKSFFSLFVFLFIYLFYLWEGNTKLATSDAWRKVFCHLNFTNLELRGLLLLLSLCSQDILCSNYRFLISAQELQNEILWLLSGRMLLQFTVERRRGLVTRKCRPDSRKQMLTSVPLFFPWERLKVFKHQMLP